jgi:hypothetical protein
LRIAAIAAALVIPLMVLFQTIFAPDAVEASVMVSPAAIPLPNPDFNVRTISPSVATAPLNSAV